MGVCSEAVDCFDANFPKGTDLRTAWDACPRDDWRVWFATHSLSREEAERLAWRFAGQAFRFAALIHPSLARFSDNLTPQNWREAYTAYAACAAYAATTDAAYAATTDAAYADAADAAWHEMAGWCAEALGLEVLS